MNSRRRVAVVLASAILVLLAIHAVGKARDGLMPEMLWACYAASFFVALGVLASWPRLVAIGFLFHLGIGVPSWALDVIATHETVWTSAALHVLTPLTGWLVLDEVPRRAVLDTWIFYLVMQPVGWLAPEALNVNVAHRAWPFLPWSSSVWGSRAINAVGAYFFLFGGAAVGRALVAARTVRERPTIEG